MSKDRLKDKIKNLNISDYIEKPILPSDFLKKIKDILENDV
jgi:hypothetical protein